MRAMILAAGLGQRLKPLSEELPKPVVPVMNRPVTWFALDHLRRHDIKQVVVNTYHLKEQAKRLISEVCPRNLSLQFSDEHELLGTGGGIRNAAPLLIDSAKHPEPVIVYNGKLVFDPALDAALEHHQQKGAYATMLLRRLPQHSSYGVVRLNNEGLICDILGHYGTEHEHVRPLMFTGVQILSAQAVLDLPEQGCVVRDGYLRWLDRGETIAGIIDETSWQEVSTVQAYFATNMSFLEGNQRWPGITVDSQHNFIDATKPQANIDRCVIPQGVNLRAGISLSKVVAWEGSTIEQNLSNAIVTPRRIVQLKP